MLQAHKTNRLANPVAQRHAILQCEPDLITELKQCGLERGWWPARLNWNGFESVRGPLPAPLVAAYLAQKKISKALKALRSLSPKAEAKAIRNIGFALDCANETGEFS